MFNLLRDEKGLTLIEVLIAAVFLTLTSVGVLGTFSSGYIVLRRSEALHKATEMARAKMEEMENTPIEEIYPADATSDTLDGTNNGRLDEIEVAGHVVAGSDAIIYCPECGYLNRVTLGTYTATCENPDKNYDGTSDDPCDDPLNPTSLPGAGQIGYYTREVRVHAFNEDMSDYDPAGSYNPDHVGPSGPTTVAVGDTSCRLAPLKRIIVEVKWMAMGKEQSYQIQTLLSRLQPKYGFK